MTIGSDECLRCRRMARLPYDEDGFCGMCALTVEIQRREARAKLAEPTHDALAHWSGTLAACAACNLKERDG